MAHPPDSVVAVFWFLSTAFLGTVAWVVAGRIFPEDSVLNRLGSAIVIAWCHVVAVGTALGATHLLRPAYFLIGVTGTAALTLVLVTRRIPRASRRSADPPDAPSGGASRLAEGVWTAVWAALFAFWAAHALMNGLLQFPTDWDTLMYHLTLVDHWLQTESLYAPDDMRWSDPGNNELITLWLVAPFSGDFLCGLTNLTSAVLLGCGALELGRQVGLSVHFRHAAGLAVVTNFVVLKQLTDVENDMSVAALLLTCLSFVFRYDRRGAAADLALGAASFGLLAGVKFYALGYAGVAAATAALIVAWGTGLRGVVRVTAWGLVGFALFGGYWYARNWIAGGSPLFPAWAPSTSEDLGQTYPHFERTTFIGNGRPELFDLAVAAVRDMTGPCHLVAFLSLPVTLAWIVATGARRMVRPTGSDAGAARVWLAVATVASGLVLLVTPFAVEDVPGTLNQMHWKYCPVRYGLCFLSLSVFVLAVVLQDVARGLRLVLDGSSWRLFRLLRPLAHAPFALLAVGVVLQATGVRATEQRADRLDTALLAADILLAATIVFVARSTWPGFGRPLAFAVVLAGAGGAAAAGDQLAARWHTGFNAHYDRMLAGGLFRHLKSTQPAGTAICVLDLRPYPFFGSARQFRVCQPARVLSQQWFEDYVRSRKIAIVAARFDFDLSGRGWMNCRVWLTVDDRLYAPVRDIASPYSVYRTVPEPAPE